ncbi:hypothetical protein FPSE_02400 [Fusarium pseudograminearum CS3096]|uniref:Uncharacterized protein n=1 Tax=Fusarium pseudograminearum (strain CS3096) TaxID=1028729 RepID=K3VPP5_FUSPC|nr:hypothetical protein FPSE_02400 [Fusarium pseudograminearum CS3096]EKJ77322.1 hypothetical protein FPSE_02400 [Fusarium pseudograminearum CS3096]
MSSNTSKDIAQLRTQFEDLIINNLVETPEILIDSPESTSQREATSSPVSDPSHYDENGQSIPSPPMSADSPMNSKNPHPSLSILTSFLQEAITDCLKPGSCFKRSIMRRDTFFTYEMDRSFEGVIQHRFDSWRWIPDVSDDFLHEYADNWIYAGDVEIISIKNDVIQSRIERKERVFEHPDNVGRVCPIGSNIKLDLSEPENAGWRVLVWRIHGAGETPYMDRHGRVVADPRVHLHQRVGALRDGAM